MKKITMTVIGLLLSGGFIVGGSSLANRSSSTIPISTYSVSDKEKPQVKITENSKDLGAMKVSDQKFADFVVKNIGTKPLQFLKLTTSCNCTFIQVIQEGAESDIFGMHNQGIYPKEIAPQKEVTIRVTYKPFLMPVYGTVQREAYVTTNDPANPKLLFQVKAFVK